MTITYAIEDGIGSEEFVDVLKRSGLAERRPVDKADVIRAWSRMPIWLLRPGTGTGG